MLSLLTIIGVGAPAFAAEFEEPESTSDIEYISTITDDGKYIQDAYINGILQDRVTIQMGEDELTYESFGLADSLSTPQTFKMSDFISEASPEEPQTTAAAVAAGPANLLGTVHYTSVVNGTVQIQYSQKLLDAITSEFNVVSEKGAMVSVLVAVVVAGFDYLITGGMGQAILVAGGLSIAGLITNAAFSTTIRGTSYAYDVTANLARDSRKLTRGGVTYTGRVLKGTTWVSQELYSGHYREFIEKQDRGIAGSFYNGFYNDTYSISRWVIGK